MALLIKGGQIVTATDNYVADIYCDDGKIRSIGHDLDVPEGTERIDAKGKLVFPSASRPQPQAAVGRVSKSLTARRRGAFLAAGHAALTESAWPRRLVSHPTAGKTCDAR